VSRSPKSAARWQDVVLELRRVDGAADLAGGLPEPIAEGGDVELALSRCSRLGCLPGALWRCRLGALFFPWNGRRVGVEDALDDGLLGASAAVEAEGLADRLELVAEELGEHVGEVDAAAADEGVDVVVDHAFVADVELEVVGELAEAVASEDAQGGPLLGGLEAGRGHRRIPAYDALEG